MARKKFSLRDFKAQHAELKRRIKSSATPFASADPFVQIFRMAACAGDPALFLKTYFPHYCTKKSPAFHRELFALTLIKCMPDPADPNEYINGPQAVTAPRGAAKSVIASFASVIYKIAFGLIHFHVQISDTEELAVDFLSFVKLEFEENDRLRHDFGDLTGKRKWKDSDFITGNGVRLLARGQGQRVRGLRFGPHRPDSVVLDDYENDKQQNNPRILEEKERWIKEAVIPALDPDGWYLHYVGTLLSSICVLARFADRDKNPDWQSHNFAALADADGSAADIGRALTDDAYRAGLQSFWPERFTAGYLLKLLRNIGAAAFNQEYMGVVTDAATQVFREKWFIRGAVALFMENCAFCAGYIDASAKADEHHDFKAQVVLGWNPKEGKYGIVHAPIRHCTYNEMMEDTYKAHLKFNVLQWGMEDVVFTNVFAPLYHYFGIEKGFLIPIEYRTGIGNKEARIKIMQPLLEQERFIFCDDAEGIDLLRYQMKYFPNKNVNDDGPDALEGAYWLAVKLGAVIGGHPDGLGLFTSGDRRGGLNAYEAREWRRTGKEKDFLDHQYRRTAGYC